MGINIPDIELVNEQERQSAERQSVSDFNQLAQEKPERAMNTLQNILLANTSYEKDPEFNALLEYRHQYTLQSLLGFVNSEEDSKKFEGNPVRREIHSIEILTNAYPKLLGNRPDDALTIAKGLCTKLQNVKELPLVDFSYKRDRKQEGNIDRTHAILKFFEITSDLSYIQSDEITVNTFKTLFQNINKADFMSISKVGDILKNYFATITDKGSEQQFGNLVKTLFATVGPLHPSSEENERSFNIATQIYKEIFMLSQDLPATIQWGVRKQIFDMASAIASNQLNFDGIRDHYLRVLWNVTSKNHGWAHDPRVLKQEISFHVKTLEITKLLLAEEVTNEDKDKNELHHTAFSVLGELLEQYANGASGRDENWHTISKRHSSKFKDGLKLYLRNSTEKDGSIPFDTLESLEKILNFKDLIEPEHPFHKEGILFYQKYFSDAFKNLEK